MRDKIHYDMALALAEGRVTLESDACIY